MFTAKNMWHLYLGEKRGLQWLVPTTREMPSRIPKKKKHMGVSKNNDTPKSSILIWFSTKKNIHFGGPHLFLETPTIEKPWMRKTSSPAGVFVHDIFKDLGGIPAVTVTFICHKFTGKKDQLNQKSFMLKTNTLH